MTHKIRVLAGIALTALAISTMTGAFAVANAQGQPDGPRPEQREDERAQRSHPMDRFVARLAENLEISEDTLRAAMRKTMEEMRPQARGDEEGPARRPRGRFWMQPWRPDRGDDGEPSGPGPRRGFLPPMPGRPDGFGPGEDGPGFRPGPARAFMAPLALGIPPVAIVRSVAEILGLTPGELRSELRGGKAIADLAREQGVSLETLAAQIAGRAEELRAQSLREAIQRFLERPAPRPAPSQP